MTLTDENTLNGLRSLNRRFHDGSLEPSGLLEALRQLGIEPSQAVLLSLHPDSGSTWCGELDDAKVGLLEFDVDLADNSNSSFRQVRDDRFRKPQGRVLLAALSKLRAELDNDR